jgi:hypothetical protein
LQKKPRETGAFFEYDGLSRDRCRGNGAPTKQARDQSEQVTADAAPCSPA